VNTAHSIIERICATVRMDLRKFEALCAAASDEEQQDMRLEIALHYDGAEMETLLFRWHPGWQRAEAVNG